MPSSRIPLVYGAAAFGKEGTHPCRIHTLPECQEVLDVFCGQHGYLELDTSRGYGSGTSEEYLSKLDLKGARVDTKVVPPLKKEDVKAAMAASLKALGPNIKIRVYYLHVPDNNTPLEETAEAINELYKAGHFEQFGLSNYTSFEVAEMYTICKERGWVLPTVYQGPYNLVYRGPEIELFPALRKYGIRFMAYSPLAGGFLAGNLKGKDDPGQPGGRFDANLWVGKLYRDIFASGDEFDALALLKEVAEKHNLTLQEIALRWIQHHSAMVTTDGVLLGASSSKQIKNNVLDSEKGPLPEDVVAATEKAWEIVKVKRLVPGKKIV